MNILDIKNCTICYQNGTPAVSDVSLSVTEGEIVSIVGESGSGKTTLIRAVLGLLPPGGKITGGEILFDGMDLVKADELQMQDIRGKEIAMIFQDSMTSLNPVMTIEKQMMEPFIIHQNMKKKQARQKALEMLKKVGIPSPEAKMKQYPHQLSGGQRQRIMIAMALSCNPEILIADEPTTALDVTIQAQIVKLMKELQTNSGTSIILITHDMGIVAEMADEIMVMYAGNVVEKAEKRELFKNPMHPYTRGLLASIPSLSKSVDRLYTIEGVVPSLKKMPKGCRFCDRCPSAMTRCREENPELIHREGRMIRCFLYDDTNREESN